MAGGQPRDLLKALAVAALVAVPISLVALGFLALVHAATDLLWSGLPETLGFSGGAWWWVLLVPTVGGTLAGLAVRHLPGGGGHDPISGFSAGPVEPTAIVGVVSAALATLAFGAVLGPEAPLIAIGSALGLWTARVFRQTGQVAALATTAGLFAAIAALFGNPLVAAFLVLEVVGVAALSAPLVAVVLPGLLAAGLGYVVFTGVGEWSGFAPEGLAIEGLAAYPSLRLTDLLWAAVLGGGLAILAFGVRAGAERVHSAASRRPAVVAALGGSGVGALALLFGVTGEDATLVLFSGQDELGTLVSQGPEWGAGVLVLLVAAKAAAYAVSLGSGFRGGPVFPALFLGAGAGMALSLVVPGLEATPAVVAGLAAGSASMLRLPVASVMLAVLITGQAGVDATTLAIVGSVVAVVTTLALSARQPSPTDEADSPSWVDERTVD